MTQKLRQHTRLKRGKIIVVTLCLVLLGIGIGLYLKDHNKTVVTIGSNTKGNTISYPPPSPNDNIPNNDRKSSATPAPTLDNGGSTTQLNSSPATFTAQIVSANVNNGNLHIGTMVYGTTSGRCSLTAYQSGQSILQLGSSSVKQDINNYDCGVFNQPTNTFPSTGTWELTLTVSNNGTQTTSSYSVTIPNNN